MYIIFSPKKTCVNWNFWSHICLLFYGKQSKESDEKKEYKLSKHKIEIIIIQAWPLNRAWSLVLFFFFNELFSNKVKKKWEGISLRGGGVTSWPELITLLDCELNWMNGLNIE